jgi:DNA-3-methyladenine glycosylase I
VSERVRCRWATREPLLSYHDTEWGTPLHDERKLFEFLVLEGAQAGLSWETILRKRDAYRKAFDRFDPKKVARYGAREVARLMKDAGIVRNRAKITAAIANARAALALADTTLTDLLWSFAPDPDGRPVPQTLADVPATTPESKALAKELKRRGVVFVGPTTAYAAMQACGVVNDHVADCWVRDAVEAARAAWHPS